MIRAECHSDDFRATAKFDATPWFQQASVEEIVDLAKVEWGGDMEADTVARHFYGEAGYGDVDGVLNATGKGIGFECHVHGADAVEWLASNRPDVLVALEAALAEDAHGMPSGQGKPYWDEDSSWTGEYNAAPAPGAPSR